MTTTRYFEVKVTGCMNCHKSDSENMLCLLGDFSWHDGRSIYQQNRHQLTDSCPMWNETKESEMKCTSVKHF